MLRCDRMKRINSYEMRNYAQISHVRCAATGNLNLIIGENGTGKSTLLKSLYAAVRSMEEYRRGDDNRSMADVLANNLCWIFQTNKLGDLVTKGKKESLEFSIVLNKDLLAYDFTSRASSKIGSVQHPVGNREGNSFFLPAREFLSLQNVILKSRDIDKSFGFDNTYYDLAKALRAQPLTVTKYDVSRKRLADLMDGKVEYDDRTGKWFYRKGRLRYSIHATSEGVKKIAILERLLAGGMLTNQSVLFVDEPEASLHPRAISVLMEVLDALANEYGVQVFIASHSYFVIKKLRILAMRRKQSMPCISLSEDGTQYFDLSVGMPDNSIIRESVRLYDEELNEVFG